MLIKYDKVKITMLTPADIDCSGEWILWPRQPDQRLKNSIDFAGQLQPVIVRSNEQKTQLVTGYKRVMALREKNRSVAALEISIDKQDCALIYAQSNMRETPAPGEMAVALRYYSRDSRRRGLMLETLGVRPESRESRDLHAWLNIEKKWDALLTDGHVPLRSAQILEKMNSADRDALFPFFENLSWSANNACKLLSWAYETARRHQISPEKLVRDNDLQALLAENLSPKDAMSLILKKMHALHSPAVAAFIQKKNDLCREIAAGTRWRAEHGANLESNELHFSSRAGSGAELQELCSELQMIKDSGGFERWTKFRENMLGDSGDNCGS
ncbi:MAG: ParB N-terminal domain-containing protein [Desulfovibrionales bacterium]